MTAVCNRCGEEKPREEFQKRALRASGISTRCKLCIKELRPPDKPYDIHKSSRYNCTGTEYTEWPDELVDLQQDFIYGRY